MRILVTGAGGQLGSEIKSIGETISEIEFVYTDFPEIDITNKTNLKQLFASHKFDYCINCAAYTAVDLAESEPEKARTINVQGVKNLAEICDQYEVTLIHISTDFVFDGKSSQPITELEKTNPISVYGLTKRDGEKVVQSSCPHHFIFRTSWLYSSYGNNFVKTMIRLGKEKDELNILYDQIGTPTFARDLAQVIFKLINEKNESYGLYHFCNEGVASWYDFACAVFEYTGINIKVNPILTAEYPTPARRPHYSVLDKSKIKSTFNIGINHWRQSLKECIDLLEKK